ncbi:hypothetical protein C440_13299 [Haloferax mucosum ATCC BAA-1512]|uniref:Uncharacterized protein n=1 Tax=Haloferax mucosum ATCC BAA-1512 TaxID=662479 RepID=M0I5P7_9EURY|nr:hypothetical protein C440_13299 [Haloferax mucosum ATCC BAA-1512]
MFYAAVVRAKLVQRVLTDEDGTVVNGDFGRVKDINLAFPQFVAGIQRDSEHVTNLGDTEQGPIFDGDVGDFVVGLVAPHDSTVFRIENEELSSTADENALVSPYWVPPGFADTGVPPLRSRLRCWFRRRCRLGSHIGGIR